MNPERPPGLEKEQFESLSADTSESLYKMICVSSRRKPVRLISAQLSAAQPKARTGSSPVTTKAVVHRAILAPRSRNDVAMLKQQGHIEPVNARAIHKSSEGVQRRRHGRAWG
ncbi:unnamed protein product, partial [Iphiclides podalirius]